MRKASLGLLIAGTVVAAVWGLYNYPPKNQNQTKPEPQTYSQTRPSPKPEPERQDFFSSEPMDHSGYAKGVGQKIAEAYKNFPFGPTEPTSQPAR